MTETPVSSPAAERFSAQQAVAAGTDYAELKASPQGLFWNEFRPQDGACRIWQWHDGQARCLTPDGFSARSRVYEYGGGSFCLGEDALVFVNEADQQLYAQAFDASAPRALTQGQCRYGDLRWAAGKVLAVEETHGPDGAEHRLVSISTTGAREVLAEGADFYAAPTLSADGQRLAWIEWSRPAQPWTATRLLCAERLGAHGWSEARCVAGAATQAESLQQPRFDADGRLYCLSDRNGYWQPWGETPVGWAALPAEQADHAGAPWQLGASTWLPLGDGGYVASWFEGGFSRLGMRHASGATQDFSDAYSRFRCLDIDDDYLYSIVASAISLPAVIAIDRRSHQVQVLAPLPAPLQSARRRDLSSLQSAFSVRWPWARQRR